MSETSAPKCPKCGSRVVQSRLGPPPSRWCRRCGYEDKPHEFEGNGETGMAGVNGRGGK